jgi:hypothetical protein
VAEAPQPRGTENEYKKAISDREFLFLLLPLWLCKPTMSLIAAILEGLI